MLWLRLLRHIFWRSDLLFRNLSRIVDGLHPPRSSPDDDGLVVLLLLFDKAQHFFHFLFAIQLCSGVESFSFIYFFDDLFRSSFLFFQHFQLILKFLSIFQEIQLVSLADELGFVLESCFLFRLVRSVLWSRRWNDCNLGCISSNCWRSFHFWFWLQRLRLLDFYYLFVCYFAHVWSFSTTLSSMLVKASFCSCFGHLQLIWIQ